MDHAVSRAPPSGQYEAHISTASSHWVELPLRFCRWSLTSRLIKSPPVCSVSSFATAAVTTLAWTALRHVCKNGETTVPAPPGVCRLKTLETLNTEWNNTTQLIFLVFYSPDFYFVHKTWILLPTWGASGKTWRKKRRQLLIQMEKHNDVSSYTYILYILHSPSCLWLIRSCRVS